jgi:hypothetical protein
MGHKIAIIGSRGYPYVYSGYEIFVKELSERLIRVGLTMIFSPPERRSPGDSWLIGRRRRLPGCPPTLSKPSLTFF